MRKIPSTMATQHPDNALPPYWEPGSAFISAYQEIGEAVSSWHDLGVSEYMWDWEGKHADAAVIDRLFSEYHDIVAKQRLGKHKFLTFRIPNIWQEKGYNLMQAMSVILSAEDLARDLKFRERPLFEIILPMTEHAQQLIRMQKLFEKLAHFKSDEFTIDQMDNTDYLEIIPLVESVDSQLEVGSLLDDYLKLHQQHFKRRPEYIRAFLACSDSALSSGYLAGLIGNKLGLSRLYEFSDRHNIPVYPIAGSGSLLFRGGLAPGTIDRFIEELPGIRTVTVQSSFRYDHSKTAAKRAIAELEQRLPQATPAIINSHDQALLDEVAELSANIYKKALDGLLPSMKQVFTQVPRRRDRKQHIGLLAYSRTTGKHSLPRAITFTGGFYSVGLPPEFIGLGRTLKKLNSKQLEALRGNYPNMSKDFEHAGRWLNKSNLAKFVNGGAVWRGVQEDIDLVESILGIKLGPQAKDEEEHEKLSAELIRSKNGAELINRMAALRKSLG